MKIRKDVLNNFIECTKNKKGYELLKLRELQNNESYEICQRITNGVFITKELVVRSKNNILLSNINNDDNLKIEQKNYVNSNTFNIDVPEQYSYGADNIHEIKINDRIIKREYCEENGNVLSSENFRYHDLDDERFKEPYFICRERLIDEEQKYVSITFKNIDITILGVNDVAIAIYYGEDDTNYSYGVILDDEGDIDRILIQFKDSHIIKSIVSDDEPMIGDKETIFDY